MSERKVYLLGGYQTDFKRAYQRNGVDLKALMGEAVDGALGETGIGPEEIQVAHIGNFVAELFCGQGQLGGLFAALHPEFSGLPATRHEGACASGSLAALAAQADIKAGHYDLACVLGVEMMRHTDAQTAADNLAAAAHIGAEGEEAQWMWPWMFDRLGEEYDRRYGLRYEHLAAIGETNFSNARTNPNAQTREYRFNERSFTRDDDANPVVEGMIRKQDCGQITDGAACVFLASESFARNYSGRRGIALGPPYGDHPAGRQAEGAAQQPLCLPPCPRHPDRRVCPGRHLRAGGARRHRDARLLHDHRIYGDRPFRPYRARRELEGG